MRRPPSLRGLLSGLLRGTRLVLLLTVLVVVGSGVSLWLALTRPDIGSGEELRPSTTADGYRPAALVGPGGPALAAAVDAAPLLLGYDYRELDAGLEAASEVLTSSYAEQYAAAFRADVEPGASARREVTVAVVRAGGLVRATDDTARCLLFVDQRVGDGAVAGAVGVDVRPQQLLVDLELVDGAWLVSGLTSL